MALYGKRPIIGFGDDSLYVEELQRDKANAIIRANHYSKKVYAGSHIHLGVYLNDVIVGVLQFGAAMNPASGGSVVKGATVDTFLELNRMWIDDVAPRNTESQVISYAIRYIRGVRKKTQWIQSFADERCGRFGVVYQAANFEYYGEHTSKFWELDGEIFHNIAMTVRTRRMPKEVWLQENKDRATCYDLRQFRYIYWIDQRQKKNVLLTKQAYPKHDNIEESQT
jgi:hypothetical protein